MVQPFESVEGLDRFSGGGRKAEANWAEVRCVDGDIVDSDCDELLFQFSTPATSWVFLAGAAFETAAVAAMRRAAQEKYMITLLLVTTWAVEALDFIYTSNARTRWLKFSSRIFCTIQVSNPVRGSCLLLVLFKGTFQDLNSPSKMTQSQSPIGHRSINSLSLFLANSASE